MKHKSLLAGVVVSLVVLGAFELLLAATHPPLAPPATDQASVNRFLASWERYWFKYGVGSHGLVWGLRKDSERTWQYRPSPGASVSEYNRQLTPDELTIKVRQTVATLKDRVQAVQRWALFAWPVGWLAFFLASLIGRLAAANAAVGDRMRAEGLHRSSRANANLTMVILAAAAAVLLAAVLFPVVMVQGDVPSGLMSAPMIAGWATALWLRRKNGVDGSPLSASHGAQ